MSRRIGRWVYDATDISYGKAGWHLDRYPVVIDFMPGHGDPPGEYQLYNWPKCAPFAGHQPPVTDHLGVDRYLGGAMWKVEREWDEYLAAARGRP